MSKREQSVNRAKARVANAMVLIVVAGVALALAPHSARSADGEPIILGTLNSADNTTTIEGTSANESGVVEISQGEFGRYTLFVNNFSASGGPAIWGCHGGFPPGEGCANPGLVDGGEKTLPDATGVFGEGAVGVWGRGAPGVYGFSPAGKGLYGYSPGTTGIGVHGYAGKGVGVAAGAGGAGTALRVNGKATFSRSGKIVIPAGASSVKKTGVALTNRSLVLATLQRSQAGVYIQGAVPNVTASSFTIHLSKPAPAQTTAAWFVVN